ncbi:MAG: hypothetical protein KGO96_07300 [Elusimicrobia bacterium]|nr:hypothetical protein [Elusimicrobiota bacterium]
MANDKFINGPVDRYEITGENPVSISFDPDAFQDLLKLYGVKFVHYTAKRCPIGLQDKFDNRRFHDHQGCSNGFLYTKAGILTAFFSTNKMEAKLRDTGVIDDSTAVLSVPVHYEDSNKEVFISQYDRLVMLDLDAKVVNWQIVEHNQSGNDRRTISSVRNRWRYS